LLNSLNSFGKNYISLTRLGLVEWEVGYSNACQTPVKALDIDRVAEAIEKKGAAPFTLDTDKFP
jgi:hypothetical protein